MQALLSVAAAAPTVPLPPVAHGVAANETWPAPIDSVLGVLLDEIDYGVVVLRDATFVARLNRAARAEIRAGRVVTLTEGHLRARRGADGAVLFEAAHAAACRGLRRLITLGDEADSMVLAFVPLGPPAADGAALTMAMFGRRRLCERLSVQWFARRHGLTAAEALVLEHLCDGLDPRAIAGVQGVQLSTVRTHVGRIREKTGAAGIRELLQQLAMLPPIVSVLQR